MSEIISENIKVGDLYFEKYISADEIAAKVKEIAIDIEEEYQGTQPLFLVIMNGAFIFAADLIRFVNLPLDIQFIQIKSYVGTQSTGIIKMDLPHHLALEGRHLIIIEDIIDTGNTIHAFLDILAKYKPASVKLASILVKPEAQIHDIQADFIGFSIPNRFVVGYGLDYDGKGRNLKDIYQLVEQ